MSKRRLIAASVVIALGVVLAVVLGRATTSRGAASGNALLAAKGDPDAGANARAVAGNRGEALGQGEGTASDPSPTSAAEEDYANRAYPLDTVPVSATQTAAQTWKQYRENKDGSNGGNNANDPLVWDLLGPTHATQPGILSFSGAQYRMAGRVTAMAISPTCRSNADCRLWVAQAGGGIWRTDNPFSPDPSWYFVSQSFDTNAIGDIEVDPNDPTGNTLYAGTGEDNASADSEAGVGIYKSTDGGNTWTLLPGSKLFNARSIGKIAIDPTNPNHLIVAVGRGVRGVSSVSGGAVSRTGTPGTDGPDQAALGVWETTDGGATFNNAFNVSAISVRGANDVAFDPKNPTVAYAAVYQQGIFRRDPAKGEVQFTKIFQTGKPAENTSRTQFDVTTTTDGTTRIYAVDGSTGPTTTTDEKGDRVEVPDSASGVWRVDNADTYTAAALLATQNSPRDRVGWDRLTSPTDRPRSAVGRETYDFCTGQCWYDEDVYTPKGYPNVVYVIGSFNYGELRGPSNGRAVLYSQTAGEPDPTCNGCTFSDLTWDATPKDQPDQTHPDQHAILTAPDNPALYFEGSDGGIIRSDGKFADDTDECARRGLDPDSLVLCQKVLSRVPLQIYDTLNKGLSTLQFQSVSLNPKRPLHDAQGGTQDNGTFDWDSQLTQWNEEIYGDGGQSGYNYCDDKIRFNSFFNQATDENFDAGKPDQWVVTSGPLFNSGGETAPFYMAEVTDYVNCGPATSQQFKDLNTPANVALNTNQTTFAQSNGGSQLGFIGFQYAGLNHVWRTVDNGGPEAYLEANCPEFTSSAADPRCGDWKPLGGPRGKNQPGDLTGSFYGSSKFGGTVAAVERDPGDAVTAWAATSAGRVFVSHNINAPDPQAVQWQRIDNTAVVTGQFATPPPRFVSSIYPDPSNPNRAWISYSGYNSSTPNTPGHVYEVTVTGATSTWRDLLVENGTLQQRNGDIPITDLVRDDLTGDLYASTDFGVLRDVGGQVGTWTRAGSSNFPYVEVSGLTIDPCSRALYAATHGRSIWRMFLPAVKSNQNQGCPRTP